MNIKDFILKIFYTKDIHHVLNADNILSFNYIENNFLNSIEFIEMIADIEQACSVSFTDEHFKSHHFSSVGGLIQMVEILFSETKCAESCIN